MKIGQNMTLVRRWIANCRERVWSPGWVGGGARAWQGGIVAVFWPVLCWAFGSARLWMDHTLRLLLIATTFGWLGVACCAAAAVLPFAGCVLVVVSLFRAASTPADRARALRRPDLVVEV